MLNFAGALASSCLLALQRPAPYRPLLPQPRYFTMGSPPAEATELKNKGNEAFKQQDWPTAVDWYTKAIDAYDQEPSFYTNRAQVCTSRARARDHLLNLYHRQISS